MDMCQSMAFLSFTAESISGKLRLPVISFGIVAFRGTPCVETVKYVTSINQRHRHAFTNSFYHPSNIFAPTRLVSTRHVTGYSPVFKTARVSKNSWRIIKTIVFGFWNMVGYLPLNIIICSSKNPVNLGKLFASRNRLCPRTYIRANNPLNVFACDWLV